MIADSNFLIPNGTFIVELIAFLIVLAVVARYMLPPLNRVLQQRQAQIQAELEAADAARAEAAAADDERRAALDEARRRAREIVEQANRTAEQTRTQAAAQGQAEHDRILASATAEVSQARQRALEEATGQMGQLVMEVVERVIGREVDEQAHRDLVDQAISAVRAEDPSAAGGRRVNPALEGYTAALFEELAPDERASVAEQLRAVDTLVAGQPALRAALTDTAVAAPARRAILSELLEGKVSDAARRLASYAVAAVRAPDVPVALSWLEHRADPDGPPLELALLGHMAARERVGGYATAVFEETATPALEEVEDQLFRFARIVESSPELRSELTDREVPAELRRAVLDELLSGKVETATLRLVRFAVTGGRPRDFVGGLDWLVERTAEARGWRVARVRAAEPIDDVRREQLTGALSHLAGAPVELQVTLEPDLIGGAVVVVGNLQVDASARGRLERIREELVPTGAARGHGQTRGTQ